MKNPENQNLPVHVGDVPQELLALANAGKITGANETLKRHRILNRLALVQAESKKLKKTFEEGSVVIPGAGTTVIHREGSVNFVPLMFFDEYITWADRKDKSVASPILAKTFDHTSEIARRAADPNLRAESYGESFKKSHTHHLNFLVMLTSGPLAGQLCAMSFSRGSWTRGRQFIGAIQMRRIPTDQGLVEAPLWATQWSLSVGEQKNDDFEWFTFDIESAEQAWTPPEYLSVAQKLHEELLREYRDKAISVDHEAGLDTAEDELESDDSGL